MVDTSWRRKGGAELELAHGQEAKARRDSEFSDIGTQSLTSSAVLRWQRVQKVTLRRQTGGGERRISSNRSTATELRDECLNEYVFIA